MNILFLDENKNNTGPRVWKESLERNIPKSNSLVPKFFGINFFGQKNLKLLNDSDILHLYTLNISIIIYFILAKIIYNKKNVFTLHGNFIIEKKDKPLYKRIFFESLYYFILKKSNIITFPSHFLYKQIIEKYPKFKPKSKIISNGIDRIKKNNLYTKKNKNYILVSVTNFNYLQKSEGVKILINAIKKIKSEKIKLFIIGDGKYINRYKTKDKRIIFLGKKKDAINWIKKSDIFIHITFLDNVPLVILEAMACGKPIIASRIGGIPEILPACQLVNNNEREIREKIESYFDKKKLKVLKEMNDKNIKYYYWGNISKKFSDIYDQLK